MVKETKVNLTNSLSSKMQEALNKQVTLEGFSSQYYLAFASWAEREGYENAARFLYAHSDEERMHMLKFIKYINASGGHALITEIEEVKTEFSSLKEIFTEVVKQEIAVGKSIQSLVCTAMELKDHYTHEFLNWFLMEQREELLLSRRALKLFDIVKDDLWRVDQEIGKLKGS